MYSGGGGPTSHSAGIFPPGERFSPDRAATFDSSSAMVCFAGSSSAAVTSSGVTSSKRTHFFGEVFLDRVALVVGCRQRRLCVRADRFRKLVQLRSPSPRAQTWSGKSVICCLSSATRASTSALWAVMRSCSLGETSH